MTVRNRMNLLNQIPQVLKNFAALGQTRLLMLGGVGVLSMAVILAAALYVNRPAYETLYVGLEKATSTRSALRSPNRGWTFRLEPTVRAFRFPLG